MRLPNRLAPSAVFALVGALALPVAIPALAQAPALEHVVVVVMENKSYDQVRTQPYAASLIAAGASFSNSFAAFHPSQPNYFALWAGSTLAIANDNCPPAGAPFSDENLGHACEAAGLTWSAYSENLPSVGATGCSYDGSVSTGLYTRKHDPWTYFTNLDHSNEKPYSQLADDIAANALPNLAFVIPNNCHNTHNSTTAGCGIPDGDAWLAANLPPILAAIGDNGVLILTWDEDNNLARNQILTVFVGAQVMPGAVSTRLITHYTITRTISALLGLPAFGVDAAADPISDIWSQTTAARRATWGRLKTLYR
jgi:acid phosphatase